MRKIIALFIYEKSRIIFFAALALLFFVSKSYAYKISFYSGQKKEKSNLELVFLPLHYQSKKIFFKDLAFLIEKSKKTRPFDESQKKINISVVRLTPREEDIFFKPVESFPYLAVRSDLLNDIAKKIKPEYKLIVIDASGFVTAAELSKVENFSIIFLGRARYSKREDLAKGFLHELGHALGLLDESPNGPRCKESAGPNCARDLSEAQRLWGDLASSNPRVHFINGCCGDIEYFRPTISSLMNDPQKAQDYGPVGERYLQEALGVKRK